jgi:DNA-binding LacI/PurR family transcriptional regulator
MIGGPPKMLCSRAREDGYRTALATAGLPVDPALIRHGDFHVERAYEEGRALLSLPDRPTAIFAGSDLQAFGLYEAARVLGLRVPDDRASSASTTAHGALGMAPLTTIRQPLAEMAATAARIVLGDDAQTPSTGHRWSCARAGRAGNVSAPAAGRPGFARPQRLPGR